MLQVLFMPIHVGQILGWIDLFKALDLITYNASKAWRKGYEEYGVEEDKKVDLVVLNGLTDIDVLRILGPPLYVIRRGKLIVDNTGPERQLRIYYKGKWETLDIYFHKAI